MDASSEKSRLRREARTRLRAWQQSPARNDAETSLLQQIRALLTTHPEWKTIALFAALPDEPNLLTLVTTMPERRWIFPRVAPESSLTWHEIRDPARDFSRGAFAIPEPRTALPSISPDAIDAWFCPGLAFTPNGSRLGRGKGFYDRALAAKRASAPLIGLCWHTQILPTIPCEPHDFRMNAIITEREIFPANFLPTP